MCGRSGWVGGAEVGEEVVSMTDAWDGWGTAVGAIG